MSLSSHLISGWHFLSSLPYPDSHRYPGTYNIFPGFNQLATPQWGFNHKSTPESVSSWGEDCPSLMGQLSQDTAADYHTPTRPKTGLDNMICDWSNMKPDWSCIFMTSAVYSCIYSEGFFSKPFCYQKTSEAESRGSNNPLNQGNKN